MVPWQLAKQWWDNHSVNETFEETFAWHLSGGHIYSTPQVFAMGREVFWDDENNIIHNNSEPNAWFVELAAAVGRANPVREFMRVAHRPHKWALWCRHNTFEIKAHDWARLAKKVRL